LRYHDRNDEPLIYAYPEKKISRPSIKTIRLYTSLDEMKRDEYREWQEVSPLARLNAAAELSLGAYRFKGPKHVPLPLQRTLVRLQQPED
jgi:hypothetical protein